MRITTFVLSLAVGATATLAWADSPSGNAGAGPALPLPEISSNWNTGPQPAGVVSTSYNSPSGSSWDQQPQSTSKVVSSSSDAPPMPEPAPDYVGEPSGGCGSPSVSVCGSQSGCGCDGGCGCGCCCNPWYGYAGGLVMTRDQPNKYWTTYNQANNADQVLNTGNASAHWDGGAEVTVGRCFGCDNKVDLTYWGIWQLKGAASITDPGNNLGTPLDTTNGGLMLNGQTADSFYAGSHETLIKRNDQVNNIELNWSYCPTGADQSCGTSSTWFCGIRFFRFDEDLLWTSVAGGFTYGENGGMRRSGRPAIPLQERPARFPSRQSAGLENLQSPGNLLRHACRHLRQRRLDRGDLVYRKRSQWLRILRPPE